MSLRRESKTRRLETATAAENSVPALPEEVLLSVRATLGGKDTVTPANAAAKRKAEEEPDDPRSGIIQNIGYDDDDDDAPTSEGAEASGRAEASGSGTKRPADGEADDRDRGDDAGGGGSNDDDGMVGAVLPFECNHCSERLASMNVMFNHLYQKHDHDGEGAAKKR